MSQRPVAQLRIAVEPDPRALPNALVELGATSLSEARALAELELTRRRPCDCCVTAHVHLTRHLGSTLFLDDDPRQLRQAIPVAERARWTPRIMAACIVLYGRARVELGRVASLSAAAGVLTA